MGHPIFNSLFYFVIIGNIHSCISSYFIGSTMNEYFDIDVMNKIAFMIPYTIISINMFSLMSYLANRDISEFNLLVKSMHICILMLDFFAILCIYNSLEKLSIFILLIIAILFLFFYTVILIVIIKYRNPCLLLSLALLSKYCLIFAGLK
jgi:hypothetical protein